MINIFTINNTLLSILSLQIISLSLKDNINSVIFFTILQLVIFIIKVKVDSNILKKEKQLELIDNANIKNFNHYINHYILPLSQIIIVNLLLLTYQTYLLHIFQFAINLIILYIQFRNIDAYYKNKFIIEHNTHYIYDITSLFIVFNVFWGGEILLSFFALNNLSAIFLLAFYILILIATLYRYNILGFNKFNILFLIINIVGFILGLLIFSFTYKFALLITYSYFLSVSLLHNYLTSNLKWVIITEYAILTCIVLLLMY